MVFAHDAGGGAYIWTHHVREKMRYYRLTEARIKRIIRHPTRLEEGIVDGAVAAMQPAGGARYSEIWTLYVVVRGKEKKVKIVSAWRYPGKTPERDPIPASILQEIKAILL